MIEVKELNHFYSGRQILKNISFVVKKNTCLGIMGESGSGKSSLARLLINLEKPSSGDIAWKGIFYSQMDKKILKEKYREIQIVFQDAFSAVNPNFTIKDVLYEPLNIFYRKKMTLQEKEELALEALEYVNLSYVDFEKKARKLSGGQLQRLCLARALIVKPKLLILDESLSGLDPLIQNEMLNLLSRLKGQLNLTYIFIAHDFLSCYYLCDEIIILDKGEIIEHIKDLDNKLQVNHPKTKKLIATAKL